MPLMSWSKHFPDQIRLPDGRVLKTLREAGNYIIHLPEPERLSNTGSSRPKS
jgi:hypothetical protein